jgi:serine/threonine protein phosphatase PrpC
MSAPANGRLGAIGFTHQGAVRAANEDTIAIGDWVMSAPMAGPEAFEIEVKGPVLALVADGMGGHAAGEVASRAVAEHLAARARRAIDASTLAELLAEANAELFALMRKRPAQLGMGTTVAGVVVGPSGSLVFNVGDSRVYRIHGSGSATGSGPATARSLEQLSTDDTPGPKLADGRTAAITSHLITQTLGGAYEASAIEPHIVAVPPPTRERYLICSDGLSDLVPRAALEACLGEDDRESVRTLFAAAIAAGARDNVSIVMLDVRRP